MASAIRPRAMAARPPAIGTRGPNRLEIRPLNTLPKMLRSAEGRNANPATNGVRCSSRWRYRLTRNTVPNQPIMNARPTPSAMRMPLG